MAQPPKYTPQTSFTTYQSQQAWFPGQQIDVEFNDIKTTTDAVEANLKLIQKDDGTLAEDIVDFSNLTDTFQAQLIAQGFVPPVAPVTLSPLYVDARLFGIVADGRDNGNGTAGGTDNRPKLQAAIDYALQNKIPQVRVAAGKYYVGGTLHLGYGDSFYSVELIGEKSGYAGSTAGVTFFYDTFDRQGINIQGGRAMRVTGITFYHVPGSYWVIQNIENTPGLLPNTASAWVNPSFSGALNQHSPKAAITVDGFGGAQPADHYPAVIYPSWTGLTTQYNKSASSSCTIERCEFYGWPVCVASGVNTDNQGDFLRVRDCVAMQWYAYGIVVCNSQSRNVEVRNINYAFGHTFYTNKNFGTGDGTLIGPVDNISGGQAYQTFDIELNSAGSLFINDLYFEAQVRVGSFTGSTAPASVDLVNCEFFTGESVHLQNPRALVEASGNLCITFDNCRNTSQGRMMQLVWGNSARTTSKNCAWYTARNYTSASAVGIITAINYGGGALLNAGASSPYDQNRVEGRNQTRYIIAGVGEQPAYWMSDAVQPEGSNLALLREGVQSFRDFSGRKWSILNRRAQNTTYQKSTLGSLAQTLDTLTFTCPNTLPNAHANDFKWEVGDIICDLPTGTLYAITVVVVGAPYQITAIQMNNYSTFSGVFVPAANVVASGGNFALIKTQIKLPTGVFFGTFSSASSTVTSVNLGNGDGSNISGFLYPGMLIHAPNNADPVFGKPVVEGTYIGAITNGSPGSLTLVDANSNPVNANANGTFAIMPVLVT